jgi:peptide/nickel transport system ATP-binding protein
MPLLDVRDLSVTFARRGQRTVHAVDGVSFSVEAGQVIGLVGESGCGKSVTSLAIMGLLPQGGVTVTGEVNFDGTNLLTMNSRAMRDIRGRDIAMIFQDPLSSLNPVQRIGTQIVEMIQSHQDVTKRAAHARAVELLDMVGIPQPAQRTMQYPHEFSGGMRQRVMIAMAISNEPSVLIADEPTTALDVTVQAQILEVLQRIKTELNAAIVLITHDLGVVARVADRVQVMYAGRAAERGSIDALFDHPSHPYTVGLMRSLPGVDRARLIPIAGAPPNMLAPPSGCAFRPRCEHARPVCAGDVPDLRPFGDLETACIRADEIAAELLESVR